MSSSVETTQIKSVSLYVGDLHPLVSDALLFTRFAELGPVVNARVCRDMVSRSSLGYGYVNFRDPKDAERALECMNYGVFFGRPFRLMWSQKDPTLRKSGKGNIFIKNLDKSITPSELYDTFEQFGKILSCKLSLDEGGKSKGFGFVHYETEEAAKKAISYVDGKEIRNRILYVGHFIPKSERKASSGAAKFNNCYVKNFGEEMDDERFRKLFEKYGEIKSACVMKNESGVSKGFGFVCFEDPNSAEAAVREMDGTDVNDKLIYVGRALRKEQRQEELRAKYEKQRNERQSRYATGVNLYVKNLDDSIDDEKLHEAFSKFGDITSAKVMRDANGVSRCFGFVCFRNAEHATLAVTNMNTVMLGNKPLYVAIAQRKDDRKAKLTADYQARMEHMKTAIYPMHPSIPFFPTAAPTAGYQANRAFYQRQYPSSAPRWQQTVVPNTGMPLGGNQAYQGGLGPQGANPQAITQIMQYRNNPASGATIPGRMTGNAAGSGVGMNVGGTQLGHMPQYARQGQNRQLGAGGMNPTSTGMQNRVNMPMNQNVSVISHLGGSQMKPVPAGNNAMQSRRPGAIQNQPQPSSQKDLSADEVKQKELLGNRLYEFVETIYPSNAAKITGVILTMDFQQLTDVFNERKELEAIVHKAHAMLRDRYTEPTEQADDKGKEVTKVK